MDEEANFANLLSQSTSINQPTWSSAPEADPWANPFASSPTDALANPFASSSSSAYLPPATLDSPREEISPYVQQLAEDAEAGRGVLPDPPSVIAAREQETGFNDSGITLSAQAFDSPYPTTTQDTQDPFTVPLFPTATAPISPPLPDAKSSTRKLPAGLIDEDLLAESDPSISLKKAFVKSSPSTTTRNEGIPEKSKPKGYVFRPAGKDKEHSVKKVEMRNGVKEEKKEVLPKSGQTEGGLAEASGQKESGAEVEKPEGPSEVQASAGLPVDNATESAGDGSKDALLGGKASGVATKLQEGKNGAETEDSPKVEDNDKAKGAEEVDHDVDQLGETEDQEIEPPQSSAARQALAPGDVPLPESSDVTPTLTRSTTPVPPSINSTAPNDTSQPSSANLVATPLVDRVAVSPLDPPEATNTDYGFKALSIGASSVSTSSQPPLPPSKDTWDSSDPTSPPRTASRFNGKGWGSLDDDDEDDGGLFGKGGPSIKAANGWSNDDSGWGEPGLMATPSSAGPSYTAPEVSTPSPYDEQPSTNTASTPDPSTSTPTNGTPRTPYKSKLLSKPLFSITVGDPTRVGDPVRGYTVYTVRTHTTSPHYRKADFSVLRRFSDFLWLFESLTMNNPGIIVPPVPDKHPFGRFQNQFVETRRLALQRALGKMTSHPVLQLDPDLRMFLESDHFAVESKNRRAEMLAVQEREKSGVLASWTGPKYTEQDDWFDSRRLYLDNLESQLKALSKSIETASKSRLELSVAVGDFADSITHLAESDLGSAMCSNLARLSDLARREKENNEEQAKADVVDLLNLADEYVRFIGSVRGAFAGRVRGYMQWQAGEKEVGRLKVNRERLRQQNRLGDRGPGSLAEINDAERRSRDASTEFEHMSKLVKSEFARFERERVEEFKRVLEKHLDGAIGRQKELVEAWEEYHEILWKMVKKNEGDAKS